MILGQLKTHEKSNEITAILELLDLLFLKDSIVAIDAMGTQKKIAEKIIIKKREYFQTSDIKWFVEKELWKNLNSFGMIKRTITKGEKTAVEKTYYVSSLKQQKENCDLFAKAVRKYWGVESSHWLLDVVFKEDNSGVRKNNGAANQSMLKKIALNILKTEKVNGSKKLSLQMKRFKASL